MNGVKLFLIVETIGDIVVRAFGESNLTLVSIEPIVSLAELKLRNAGVEHFVGGKTVEACFKDDQNPSKGKVFPSPVVLFAIVSDRDSERK